MTDGNRASQRAPLIVWCADAQAGGPVLDALRHGFDLDLRPDLPDLPERAAPDPDADPEDTGPDTLLLCLSPIETLCRAMARGIIPSQALGDWQDQARAIIALNRQDRRHVRILDIAMATAHPEAFVDWFDLPADKGLQAMLAQGGAGPGDGAPAWDDIVQLLAQRALTGAADLRALLGEMEAVSLNFAKVAPVAPGDPDAAFAAYQEGRQLRQQTGLLQAQNRAAQDELEALSTRKAGLEQELEQTRQQAGEETAQARQQAEMTQAQNQLMRQELEALVQGKAQLEQRLEQLSQGVESYQTQMDELRGEAAGLRHKGEDKDQALKAAGAAVRALEAQVAQLQDGLSQAGQGRAKARQALAAAEQRLQTFQSSRSYRLTAPLRKLRALISGRRPV